MRGMDWLSKIFGPKNFHTLSILGEIDHHYIEQEPSVSDPKIGESQSFPAALRIIVSPEGAWPLQYIGSTAHQALFASYPEFAFKVVFASAKTSFWGQSDYANPASIWFNVFFGYYELDAPVRLWNRPFGYQSEAPDALPAIEDIVRVGKADWNYFSNHMYGVPREAISPLDVVDMSAVKARDLGREKIGPHWWDHVTLNDVTVVSGARSTADALELTEVVPVFTPVWQRVFGKFGRSSLVPKSFPAVQMAGEFFMSFKRERDQEYGEEVYKTFIFGGTINQGYADVAENARFLSLQLDSLKQIIPNEQRTGFDADRPAPDEVRAAR